MPRSLICRLLLSVLAVSLLAGCGTAAAPLTATSSVPTPTAIPATVTPDLAATATTVAFQEFKAGAIPGWFADPTNAAAATAAVEQASRFDTAIALTPTAIPWPTWTPAPTVPPLPTPTWFVGMIADTGCIARYFNTAPQFPSCWRAQVDGAWFLLGGGYDGDPGAQQRSLFLVCPEPCHRVPAEEAIYPTPYNDQDVLISAVNGALVTVVPRDPTIPDLFVFDLRTRQWVSGTPGPATTPATVTPDLAATATTVAFQELKGGYPQGAFADPTNAAAATAARERYSQYQTAVALTPSETPAPTWTAAPTTPPLPTPTWFVGMITDTGCLRRPYPLGPLLENCWHTQVNGNWFLVAAGYDGTLGVDARSILMVCPETCHLMTDEEQFYHTPINDRDVHIIAVNGPLVTLVPRAPTWPDVFVFDIRTRQWVSPTPVPTAIANPRSITATPALPTPTAIPATVTPDLAATATTVAFQEFKAGYPPGWLSNPIHAAAATVAAGTAVAYQTATALTPTTTEPAWTPEPTPTLGLGLIIDMNCWSAVHPGAAQFDSCWETNVSGTWIRVGAGYRGESLDHSLQGLLWVCREPCDFPNVDQLYPAPRFDLHIITVTGAVVTLTARDPNIHDMFVFDITTHQWTPLPSPTP